MLGFIFGAFLVVHGLVHMPYFGQSQKLFGLQRGLAWPDGSWAFSNLVGDDATRTLASAACVLAAIGILVGGAGALAKQGWWPPVIVGAAALSSLVFSPFWNGRLQRLDDQGMIGILIMVVLIDAVLVFRWPRLAVWLSAQAGDISTAVV